MYFFDETRGHTFKSLPGQNVLHNYYFFDEKSLLSFFFCKIIFSLIFDKTFIVICLMFGSKSYWPNERSTVQSYSSIAHIHTFIFMPRKANVIISPLKQSVDLKNGAKNSTINMLRILETERFVTKYDLTG